MHKPILICGEAWGEHEEQTGKAFAGPSGSVLRSLLYQVGIAKEDCYLTNVFNFRPPGGRVDKLYTSKANSIPGKSPVAPGKYIHKDHADELRRLKAELERVQPNLILALGNVALWAITGKTGIKKYRGSPLYSTGNQYKVIPTWHPSSILRQWELRVIALADFTKAKREAAFPELHRPSRKIYLAPDLQDIEDFYHEFIIPAEFLSCDIETKALTITEVGYAIPDGSVAIVIPFYSRAQKDGNYWRTLAQERTAWDWIRKINREKPLIGQNFAYDMQYFWRMMKIPCPQFLGDTMLMHHSLQPELEKGLGFLGSIYTNEPSWKFMRTDHSTMKREDD